MVERKCGHLIKLPGFQFKEKQAACSLDAGHRGPHMVRLTSSEGWEWSYFWNSRFIHAVIDDDDAEAPF